MKAKKGVPFSNSGFNYESISPSVAKFLKGQAERIRKHCATSIIQIGKSLAEAKRHLSHGEFLQWVECEVSIPARTAQAYMRAASWAAGKSATVAHLPPSVLYVLSSAGVPEEFTASILDRVKSGAHIPPWTIREELKAFRSCKHEKPDGAVIDAGQHSDEHTLEQNDNSGFNAVLEAVAILQDRLCADDFARVRELVTSDLVLSDPQLPQNLGQAFKCATQNLDKRVDLVASAAVLMSQSTFHGLAMSG